MTLLRRTAATHEGKDEDVETFVEEDNMHGQAVEKKQQEHSRNSGTDIVYDRDKKRTPGSKDSYG
jgi:hypothetical protein